MYENQSIVSVYANGVSQIAKLTGERAPVTALSYVKKLQLIARASGREGRLTAQGEAKPGL
jgi:hypothetical protein